jgi:hypothetical protein
MFVFYLPSSNEPMTAMSCFQDGELELVLGRVREGSADESILLAIFLREREDSILGKGLAILIQTTIPEQKPAKMRLIPDFWPKVVTNW